MATSNTSSWTSEFNITANAPVLQPGAMTVQDNGPGCNNNGILDPGETASLLVVTGNTGHAGLTNVIGNLSIAGGSSPFLVISNSSSAIGTLAAGMSGSAVFTVTAASSTPIGTPVDLQYTVSGGTSAQYQAAAPKQVVIGLIPTYIMSTSSVSACTGYFYDPGGPAANYSDNQDFVMVINPGTPGSLVRAVFTSFELESQSTCTYDYLKIYDGSNTSAPLLGTWCGTNSPGTIIANNNSGALTFVFHSDVSITKTGWQASINCISGIVPNPLTFAANTISSAQIDLLWSPNASGHQVMVVCAMTPVFGTPVDGMTYAPGSTITGGGTVVCTSAGTSFNHTGLNASTTYYYKAFSCDASGNYSSGLTASANTSCGTILNFPWSESFENAGTMPNCWTQEYVTIPGLNWAYVKGNGSSNPSTAHTGNYNACLKDVTGTDNKTRLVSPKLDLSGLPQPQITFWHTQADWYGDQDQLLVYYKNSAAGGWILLASYTGNITTWTQETISLPDVSDNYYLAFEGNAKYGYGVCIDDVVITSMIPATTSVNDVIINDWQCFEALQTITVAGNGHTFKVADGGVSIMIAGQKILYLPGTTVDPGGYLHGYIAPLGPFCSQPTKPAKAMETAELFPTEMDVCCNIWPNPTTGIFHVSLKGFSEDEEVRLEVFNLQGIRVISSKLTGNLLPEFSLAGKPSGVYLVRIVGSKTANSFRIVKQ